jgi:hypothetical protein
MRADADEAACARVRTAARVLDHQRRHNAERIDGIIRREAAAHGWPEELARHYLVDLALNALQRCGMERVSQMFERGGACLRTRKHLLGTSLRMVSIHMS